MKQENNKATNTATAESTITETVYSPSRINSFTECERQFYLKYIEEMSIEADPTIEACLGITVHEALQVLYEELRSGHTLTKEELLEVFTARWNANWDENTRMPKEKRTPEVCIADGRAMLSSYYDRFYPFDQGMTAALEPRLFFTVGEADYRFVGHVDRLELLPDGTYVIHEYKTGKNTLGRKRAAKNKQLALYEKAVRDNYPDAKKVICVLHRLRDQKAIDVEHAPEELNAILEEVANICADIESRAPLETSFPAKPFHLCPWCMQRPMCKEGSKRCGRLTLSPDERRILTRPSMLARKRAEKAGGSPRGRVYRGHELERR